MSAADQQILRLAAQIVEGARKDVMALAGQLDTDAADKALTGACDGLTDTRNYLRNEADDIPSDDEAAGVTYWGEVLADQAAYRARAL